MRLIILCFLIYVGYRVLKWIMVPSPTHAKPESPDDLAPVDDVMVKDPVCDTYIAKRSGIKEVIKGEPHYFCSTQCRDKYFERVGKAGG